MRYSRTFGSLVAATAVLMTPLGSPAPAEAHGHHGGVYIGVGFGGYWGWGPYWGPYWGWGWPYWGWGPGPSYYGAPGGVGMGYAMMSGMGALDLDVKPKQAEVWADGQYVAEARDLDGDPSYLWLQKGSHHIVVYKAGYRSFEEDVYVRVAMVRELKLKLEPGESAPPAQAQSETRGEPEHPEGSVPQVQAAPSPGEARGQVGLRVKPADATVYVDGEYRGTASEVRRLQLSPGHHRVEVVRPGFRPLEKEFDVEAGRTTELELSMERDQGWKY
jgi:hypothetical protein